MENFKLVHDEGKLIAVVVVDGVEHRKEVTDYFNNDNPHDDWLDYKIGLKDFEAKKSLEEQIGQLQSSTMAMCKQYYDKLSEQQGKKGFIWLKNEETGNLMVFTRGEYSEQILTYLSNLK